MGKGKFHRQRHANAIPDCWLGAACHRLSAFHRRLAVRVTHLGRSAWTWKGGALEVPANMEVVRGGRTSEPTCCFYYQHFYMEWIYRLLQQGNKHTGKSAGWVFPGNACTKVQKIAPSRYARGNQDTRQGHCSTIHNVTNTLYTRTVLKLATYDRHQTVSHDARTIGRLRISDECQRYALEEVARLIIPKERNAL